MADNKLDFTNEAEEVGSWDEVEAPKAALDFSAEADDFSSEAEPVIAETPELAPGDQPAYNPDANPNRHVRARINIDGKEYSQGRETGTIYDPEGKVTVDPSVLTRFKQDKPTKAADSEYRLQNDIGTKKIKGVGVEPPKEEDKSSLLGDLEASWYQLQQANAGNELVAAHGNMQGIDDPNRLTRAKAQVGGKEQFAQLQIDRQKKAVKGIGEFGAKADAVPEAPAAKRFNESKTFGDAWNNFFADPYTVIRSTAGRSAALSVPSVVGGIVGSIVGPGGSFAGSGFGSYTTEMGSNIASNLQKLGADLNDPESIMKVWKEHGDQIIQDSHIRAAVVGGVDGLGGVVTHRIAGMKTLENKLADFAVKEVGGALADATTGAVGELGAEITMGEPIQPGALAAEFVGDLGPGAVQIAGQQGVQAIKNAGAAPEPQTVSPEEFIRRAQERDPNAPAPSSEADVADFIRQSQQPAPGKGDRVDPEMPFGPGEAEPVAEPGMPEVDLPNVEGWPTQEAAPVAEPGEGLRKASKLKPDKIVKMFEDAGITADDIKSMSPEQLNQTLQDLIDQGAVPEGTKAPQPQQEAKTESPAPETATPKETPPVDEELASHIDANSEPAVKGEGTRARPVKVEDTIDVAEAGKQVNTEPTEGQKGANNYTHGHIVLHGLNVSIENPKGSIRTGKDADGNEWQSPQMPATYGYIRGSVGNDGDHIDTFVGDDIKSQKVFVIDQIDQKTGRLDEHKVMLSLPDIDAAKAVYDGSFADGLGRKLRRNITETTVDGLKDWLNNGNHKKPFVQQRKFHGQASRNEQDAGIQGVEPNETALPQSKEQGLSQVRREGDINSPGLGQQLPGISGINGQKARQKNDVRPDKQRSGVQPGELLVGNQTTTSLESKSGEAGDVSGESAINSRVGEGIENPVTNDTSSTEEGNSGGESPKSAQTEDVGNSKGSGRPDQLEKTTAIENSSNKEQINGRKKVVNADSPSLQRPAQEVPDATQPENAARPSGEQGTASVPGPDRAGSDGDVRQSEQPDAEQPEPAEGVRSEDQGTGSDSGDGGRNRNARADKPTPAVEAVEKDRETRSLRNYHITEEDHIGEGGARVKINGNIEAIRTLKDIELERREATDEDKKKLVKYVGWGAFAQDVFAEHKPEFTKERAQLKELLTSEELAAARRSTLNAHYTSPEVIKGMWDALGHLGYKSGRALEPSAGVGHFIGLQPRNMASLTDWSAVELDSLTGRILQKLYAGSDVTVDGFENFQRPKGFYDLAVSNVPFGDFKLGDKAYPPMNIHDYFFVKSLDLVRPGGIVTFITSSGTMDKQRDRARKEIDKRADFLGAIRLPGGKKGAFAGNAGTEVTTDIIFLRKRAAGEQPSPLAKPWNDLKQIVTPEGPAHINEYFAANPKMMLGEMRLAGTMYRQDQPVLVGDAVDIDKKILEAAKDMLPEGAMLPRARTVNVKGEKVAPQSQSLDEDEKGTVKEGAFYIAKDGKINKRLMGVGTEASLTGADQDRVRALIGLRDTVNGLLKNQAQGGDNKVNEKTRAELSKGYAAFVKKFGPINLTKTTITTRQTRAGDFVTIRKMPNFNAFRSDPDAYKVAALEIYDEDKGTAEKAAIFNANIIGIEIAPMVSSPSDAIAVSLNQVGRVDIDTITHLLNETSAAATVKQLGDLVFQNPESDNYETREQYLAGDVVKKLYDAKQAAKSDRKYQRNVDALEDVQPPPLTRDEIRAPMGAAWVPVDIMKRFFEEEVGTKANISINPYTKTWAISGWFDTAAQTKYGTSKMNVQKVAEGALNQTPVRVEWKDREGKVHVDEDGTREAMAKVTLLRDAFKEWIWNDDHRAVELENLYNNMFNRLAPQKFDGSHLTLPGLASTIRSASGDIVPFSLRPHQKNAIWRVIQNGNTLLDHVVGAGKTFTMIAAGMEQKRLGLVERPIFSVPNHMLEQFTREFLQAYPGANILVAQKDEMTRDNRRAFVAKVAAQSWDGIIITHDAFGRIGMSKDAYKTFYDEQIQEMKDAKEQANEDEGKNSPTVKQMEKLIKRMEVKLEALTNEKAKDVGVTFEEMGVDQIILDEAHLFKNLTFVTRHTRVKGMGQGESQRATDMFIKLRFLESRHPNRSAIFATGTPISNTMAEMFTMQRYLQLATLEEYNVDKFDAWASTFGEIVTQMQLSADGRTFRETTSFSKFTNIPELVAIYSMVADTQTADMLNLPRPKRKNGKVTIIEAEPSPREDEIIEGLIKRAEEVRGKKVEKGGDNMLKIVSEGRKVATDARLLSNTLPFNPNGKVNLAVNNIHKTWKEGQGQKLPYVQMIFLDMGVPFTEKEGAAKPAPASDEIMVGDDGDEGSIDDSDLLKSKFNLYQDIKDRLIKKGIPKEQIAFIHDANDDAKKAQLFAKVRSAKITVLIGSTGKMGVGTNVQRLLKAMHHLDAPWKPAEVAQRDGRIERQGNLHDEIEILRYITKRSFDSFMWQTLERKAAFIAQIQAGARGVREAEDIDSPLPEAAELKAAASGDPRIMEHAELSRSVRDLEMQQSTHMRTIATAKREVAAAGTDIINSKAVIEKIEKDLAKVEDLSGDKFKADLLIAPKGAVNSRKTMGEAIRDFMLEQMDTLPKYKRSKFTVGTMSGFKMQVELYGNGVDMNWTPFLTGETDYFTRDETAVGSEMSPVGISQRFTNLLGGVQLALSNYNERVATAEKTISKLGSQSTAKPFPKQKELDEGKARLEQLTKDLSPKKPEPSQAAPSMPMNDDQHVASKMTDKQISQVKSALQDVAVHILGHKVNLGIVDQIAGGEDWNAAYFYDLRKIFVAMAKSKNPVSDMVHELVHYMVDNGIITKPEYAMITRWAQSQKSLSKISRYYDPHYRNNTDYTDAEVKGRVAEEVFAFAVDAKVQGKTIPDDADGRIAKIIKKVLEFIEKLRNLMAGAGFKTADKLIDDIIAGKMKGRKENPDQAPRVAKSVDAAAPSRKMPKSNPNLPVSFIEPEDNAANIMASNQPLMTRLMQSTAATALPIRRELQDKMVDMARTEQAIVDQTGAALPGSMRVYQTETLYSGRAGERLEDLRMDVLEPMAEAMHRLDLTLEDLDLFLYARHAPERNAYIASINPAFPDGGSGMMDDNPNPLDPGAVQVNADLQQRGKYTAAEQIAHDFVDPMLREARNKLLSGQIIDQHTHTNWSQHYKCYVPLRGDPNEDESGVMSTGRKYDTRTNVEMKALGRKSRADSPAAHVIAQAQQAIILAEKARVGRSLLRLARRFPNKNLWEVDQVVTERYLNKATGMVATRVNTQKKWNADNMLAVREGGNLYWITIHHMGLAKGMRGIDAGTMHIVLRTMMNYQRYYALSRTGLDPQFFIPNFLRDLQTAGIHIGADQGAAILKETLKNIPRAMRGVFSGERGKLASQWAQHYREFALAGGKVGAFGLESIDVIKDKIEAEIKVMQGGPVMTPYKMGRSLFRFMMNVNSAVENAVRLSLYVAMRNAGYTQDEAAFAAKEVTVNFNRSGNGSKYMNGTFVFFNAGVQGTTRVAKALIKSKAVRRVAMGLFVTGMVMAFINPWMAGDDDDDGLNDYDQIPEWIRERNLIIMIPGADKGGRIQMPMPWVYNVFQYAGDNMGRVIRGKLKPMEAAANIGAAFLQAANPIQADSIASALTPTLLKPWWEVKSNQDWKGDPIYPEDREGDTPKPDSQHYFKSVNPFFKDAAQVMNSMTGGDEARPGAVDVSPESLEYTAEFLGGGIMSTINQIGSTAGTLWRGDEVQWERVPFVRKVYGTMSTTQGRTDYYTMRDAVNITKDQLARAVKGGDRETQKQIRTEYGADIKAAPLFKETDKLLTVLRKARNLAANDEDRIALQERMDKLMAKTRKAYRKMMELK